jgi:hypothetical protein
MSDDDDIEIDEDGNVIVQENNPNEINDSDITKEEE